MPIDILIARWLGIFWIIVGLSHLLHPAKWASLLLPLRDRDTGGFILAGMSLPIGLVIILGHNIWVWDIPVIVTVAGWMTSLKSVIYLLFPSAHTRVMSSSVRLELGIRLVGMPIMILGALVAYDAFCRR
jgi:uncharacterized protein YjeT (DUF2065 family)